MCRSRLSWRVGLSFAISVLHPTLLAAGGKYAAEYLRLGAGVEAVAVGACGSVLPGGPTSFLWNPALGLWGRRFAYFEECAVFGSFGSSLASLRTASAGLPLGFATSLQMGYVKFSVEGIPRYPELAPTTFGDRLREATHRGLGEPLGRFEDSESALYVGLARRFHLALRPSWLVDELSLELPVGVAFKRLSQSLDLWKAHGYGIDAGAALRIGLGQFGEGLRNGELLLAWRRSDLTRTRLTWETGMVGEVEPVTSVGAAYSLRSRKGTRLLLALQDDLGESGGPRVGLAYRTGHLEFLAGRGENGWSFGLVFSVRSASFGYARQIMALGAVERVGAELTW
ncbi:MAG: hypothetical protein ONB23_11675 [candidate division KSB1 bacterium]|nr:hypothetical protein [candidate division KSB1 bacterium]